MITENECYENGIGLSLDTTCDFNRIGNNLIKRNTKGIVITNSDRNNFSHNVISNNEIGFHIRDGSIWNIISKNNIHSNRDFGIDAQENGENVTNATNSW